MIFNDDYQTGRWLRGLRMYEGLTQKQMAERLGVKRGTYSCWESKYKYVRLPQKVLHKVYGYLIKPCKVEVCEEESIFKRILKWIMRKN